MEATTIKFTPVNIEERAKLDVRPGDTVRLHFKIVESGKTRLQPYEGLVIARKHGSEPGATITVRRVAEGVGMERIIPIYSPMIGKFEVLKRSKVRRAKLYYIREKAAKETRKKMKQELDFVHRVVIDEMKVKQAEEKREEVKEEKKVEKEEVKTEPVV